MKGEYVMTNNITDKEIQRLVAIAMECIPTLAMDGRTDLETKNSDRDDFLDVAVWCLKSALIEAYKLGKNSK